MTIKTYFVDVDGVGDNALWEVVDGDTGRCVPILYQDNAHPAVWRSAVNALTVDLDNEDGIPNPDESDTDGFWPCCGVARVDYCQC